MTRSLKLALARRRWRPCDAEVVLEALAASGRSMSAFAVEHGLQHSRLRRWPRRLRLRAEAAKEAVAELPPAGALPAFLPVHLCNSSRESELAELASMAPAPRTLDVSVGVGCVHVPVDFEIDHLRRIVEALAARC